MLANAPGRERKKYTPDYVVYDLETTGISCQYDEVIEISAIRVRDGHPVETFTQLVNPGRPIPYGASSVNHIYDAMVRDKPHFREALAEFLAFIGDDVLVGHNIKRFDMNFIYRDCQRYFGKTIDNDYIDTLHMAKACFPDWKHRKLENLAEYYGISTQGAHRALQDCHMNQQVFELMAKEDGALSAADRQSSDKISARRELQQEKGRSPVPQSKEADRYCPRCNAVLKKRHGRFGWFWGCSGFPACRYTENI